MFKKSLSYIIIALIFSFFVISVFNINHNIPLYSDDYLYSFKFDKGFIGDNSFQVAYTKIHDVKDYINSLTVLYNYLTGRLVAHGILQFLLLFPPIIFDILNSLAIFILCFLMIKWVLPQRIPNFMLYLLISFSMFYTIVAVTYQNFYVAAFSCNYIWTLIITLGFLYQYKIQIYHHVFKDRDFLYSLVIFIWGFVVGDTNEPVVPGIIAFLIVYLIYKRINKQHIPLWMYYGLWGVIAGFCFLYFAPGNTQRLMYETRFPREYTSLKFNISSLAKIVFLSLPAIPTFLISLLSLFKIRIHNKIEASIPLIGTIIIIILINILILFLPVVTLRFTVFFGCFYTMIALYAIYYSNYSKPAYLWIVLILMLPLVMFRVYSDYQRSVNIQNEYRYFLQQIRNHKNEEVLVSPRAYADPITQQNWAKAIAQYHGLKSLWVNNMLQDSIFGKAKNATYTKALENFYQGHGVSKFYLSKIRYYDNSRWSRTQYLEFCVASSDINISKLPVYYYSINIKNRYLKKMFELLPFSLKKYIMVQSIEFRQREYQITDSGVILVVSTQNTGSKSDYVIIKVFNKSDCIYRTLLKDVIY